MSCLEKKNLAGLIFSSFFFLCFALSADALTLSMPSQEAAMQAKRSGGLKCTGQTEPLTDWSNMFAFYKTGGTNSVVDAEKMKNYRLRLRQLSNLKKQVNLLITQVVADDAAGGAQTRCVIDEMVKWANARALVNGVNNNGVLGRRQAVLENIWASVLFAQAYFLAERSGVLTQSDKDVLRPWFAELSAITRNEFTSKERKPSERWLDARANHWLWAGAAVGNLSAVLQDQTGFDWSISVLRQALTEAPPDGSLPRELKRGARSLHYQSFAMLAIANIIRLVDANAVILSSEEDKKIIALATFSLGAYLEPEIIQKKTGYAQEKRPDMLNWVDAFESHIPPAHAQLKARLRNALGRANNVSVR
jgi:hypothetical protein